MSICHSDKPIVIVAPSGEIASYFESARDAAKILGASRTCILRALRNHSFYLKKKWVYEEEYRAKWMSGSHIEYAYDYEQCRLQKLRDVIKNRSEEKKQQIHNILSENAKNRYYITKTHNFHKINNKRPVICVTTGVRYDSVADFADSYNIDRSSVSRYIRKGLPIRNLIVKYVNEYNEL